ncbi:MAG: ribonuclease HII [Alphaproteobacteria bacterium]|nr:ribonuclease HII [Alphaproteobacteria bacterium]
MPDFEHEDRYKGSVCGIDEVGRGPLAGPVVAACVLIPKESRSAPFLKDIKDSKKLSKPKRLVLSQLILQTFPAAVAVIGIDEIDRLNILQASLKAMAQALMELSAQNEIAHALIDGNRLPHDLPCSASAIIKGDSQSISIAAASIVAKVHRDGIMEKLDREYPQYGWRKNSGYPTTDHLAALENYGVTPHHRRSFGPVKALLAKSA